MVRAELMLVFQFVSYYNPLTSRREYAAWVNAFCDILERLHPSTASFFKLHGVWDVAGMAPLFRDFFTTLLPQKYVLRILDMYTMEGAKVIFRFGVALLCIFKMDQHNTQGLGGSSNNVLSSTRSTGSLVDEINSGKGDSDSGGSSGPEYDFDVWGALRLWAHDERFNFEFLVKKAYGVHGQRRPRRFPRRNILARIIKMEEERLLSDPTLDTSDVGPARPLGIAEPFIHREYDRDELGGYDKKPPEVILAQPTAHRILLASWLPLSLRMTKLQLLFSTNTHGRMLEMFYARVGAFKHTILLAEVFVPGAAPGTKTIIGWYASQAWRISSQVYGDGECVLFRLSPKPKAWKWQPQGKSDDFHIEEEDTSCNNNNNDNNDSITKCARAEALMEQFQVGTANFISMGGNTDGSCGLRFNEDLTRAESAPAVGFENEPLAGVPGDLEIGLVEVYGLQRPT